ncbi:hypothetical protein F3I16_06870 [Pseudomonas sp. L-22-4S-12]|uniref:hypothetical protein n=1 Tax=Pseudomonas sp. L-22-4S-12 TaxID=2610893 RepID=UPI001324DE59|nr:hypothetical protein [Pseudomonas sp. L-22-4S-12]MWV15771.1 hypothetical protein [Pseudomonas sp. L-22-4S-12]
MHEGKWLAAFCLVSSAARAEPIDCAALDAAVKTGAEHRPYIGEVIGQGRAPFHSAPDAACPIRGKFIIPGDGVAIYSEYGPWSQILYPAGGEEDAGVWVRSERLRVLSRPDGENRR